jgi:hypothetical protein
MKTPQKSLKDWGDQKWRTKSGKPSSKTGERYLPDAAIKSLSPSEYAATTKAKRAGKAQGITGYYSIFVKGKPYSVYSTQNLDEALAKLREIEIRNANDVEEFKRIRREIGY